MAGNTLGKLFQITTFGESHGIALGAIVDGVPPNMPLSEADIQLELDRRKPGQNQFTTPRREGDQVRILSGVFEGKTIGTPIGLLIENEDVRGRDYSEISQKFRPNHGDFTYQQKYGIRDYRGGGRASARETAMRVAAGAIAKKFLRTHLNVEVRAYVCQIGAEKIAPHIDPNQPEQIDWSFVNSNPFFSPDSAVIPRWDQLLREIKKAGDSVGAMVQIVATNVPVGLGEPVFDRLDADLAKALMSINAVKGVEIGDGMAVASQRGSTGRDEMTQEGFLANHAGGVLAGISSGQNILARIALKPTPSIKIAGQTLTTTGETCEISTKGRHDPCVGIRAVPIAEAMVALVLMDHWLRFRGQCGE